MGRRPMKPSIKRFIVEKALKDKKTPREALAVELKKIIEEMYEIPPSQETMIKLISKARNMESPLDKPWSTASMAQYPIPAEALPALLKLWVWIAENIHDKFTIREAQLAARYYTITKDMRELAVIVRGDALSEIIFELEGLQSENSSFGDILLFTLVTGEEMPFERKKRILKHSINLTDEQWDMFQQVENKWFSMSDSEINDIPTDGKLANVVTEAIKKRKGIK